MLFRLRSPQWVRSRRLFPLTDRNAEGAFLSSACHCRLRCRVLADRSCVRAKNIRVHCVATAPVTVRMPIGCSRPPWRGDGPAPCIRRRALARAASRLHVDGRQCRMAASHTLCRVSHEAVPVYCVGRALRQAQRPCRVYNRPPLPAGPLSAFCPTICTEKQRRISLAQNELTLADTSF